MRKIYSLLMIIAVFLVGLAFSKPVNVDAAIISNRTVDNAWVFKLDDSTGTLTIQVKNGQTSGGLASAKKTESAWQDVWKKAYNDPTDIRPMVEHIKFITNDVGTKFDFNSYPTAYMFNGFTNVEDIDFSGVVQDSEVAETIRGMFQNCSKLKEVDLSWMATKDNSLQNMQDLFNGCSSLEKVTINNPKFITRKSTKASDGTVTNGAAQMGRMFQGCSKLKEIDMSNITLYGRDNNWTQINNVFTGTNLPAIETIKMDNIKLPNFRSLDNVFTGLSTLTNFSMKSNNPGDIAPDTQTMVGMFKNSFTSPSGSGEATLDISGFGKLKSILNMDDFILGCSGLEKLIFDNLDNSNIGPTNNNHSITPGQTGYVTEDIGRTIGAKEYGREIFGKKVYDIPTEFPNLKTVSAKKSNIWLVKNNKGTPGAEYYDAGSDSVLLYLFNTKTTLTPDGKSAIVIDSKRDYVDMITDRDGIKKHTYNFNANPLPDASSNLNIINNYNLNGPGRLAAGVYEITDAAWKDEPLDIPETYYRIAYIGEVPFKIEGIEAAARGETGSDPQLILQKSENYAWLNTRGDINWPTSGDYTIDRSNNPIKITYQNAAIDVNGKKHNVVITIKKITFKNLERIPTHAGSTVIHDPNKYIDYHPTDASNEYNQSQWTTENTGYYRTVLSASRSDGVNFRNYIRVGDGNTRIGSTSDFQVLSGGSGTDIDFTIEIEKANNDTSFVFHGKDLDIAESQDWVRPNNDHDYENLPIENATYGLGGEAFVLGSGNDLNTVTFAKHTGLKLVSKTRSAANTVVTTGSDPNTTWSEFGVKSNAKGADFTWTSGVGCNTYALINTPAITVGEIEIQPVAKVLEGGTLEKDQFEFTLEPDSSVADNKATGSAITAKNDANGNVVFDAFKFDSPTVEIDGHDYYPGTINDETNTEGNGTHNKFTYAWTIKEKDGGNENIDYDLETKKLKVVIYTPETDAEALKGIKAEIYVNDKLVKTVWTSDVKDNKFLAAVTFKNTLLREITLKKTWIGDNDFNTRPTDLKGYVTYESNNKKTTVRTDENGWTKDNDVWTYKFKIPADAKVTNWGEDTTKEYEFKKEKQEADSEVYPMTNTLKKYDLTISKQVTGNKGDKNKKFNIAVKIFDENGAPVTGTFKALVNGEEQDLTATDIGIKLSLKHGDKVTIKDIRIGYKYQVEEEDTEYIEYYNVVSDGKVIKNTTEGIKYDGTMDKDYTITFTNDNDKLPEKKEQKNSENKEDIPQTGDNIVKYFAILMLSALGMVKGVTYIRKHSHQ